MINPNMMPGKPNPRIGIPQIAQNRAQNTQQQMNPNVQGIQSPMSNQQAQPQGSGPPPPPYSEPPPPYPGQSLTGQTQVCCLLFF